MNISLYRKVWIFLKTLGNSYTDLRLSLPLLMQLGRASRFPSQCVALPKTSIVFWTGAQTYADDVHVSSETKTSNIKDP
jgi:hypothetical protein